MKIRYDRKTGRYFASVVGYIIGVGETEDEALQLGKNYDPDAAPWIDTGDSEEEDLEVDYEEWAETGRTQRDLFEEMEEIFETEVLPYMEPLVAAKVVRLDKGDEHDYRIAQG